MIKILVLCLLSQITISDRLPPPVKYPSTVYQMTGDEYYQWATDFNLEKVKALPTIYAPRWITGSETDTDIVVENYGNYRGNGGYTGYGLSLVNTQSVTFPKRFLNPDYVGPGPLIILNPYCKPEIK